MSVGRSFEEGEIPKKMEEKVLSTPRNKLKLREESAVDESNIKNDDYDNNNNNYDYDNYVLEHKINIKNDYYFHNHVKITPILKKGSFKQLNDKISIFIKNMCKKYQGTVFCFKRDLYLFHYQSYNFPHVPGYYWVGYDYNCRGMECYNIGLIQDEFSFEYMKQKFESYLNFKKIDSVIYTPKKRGRYFDESNIETKDEEVKNITEYAEMSNLTFIDGDEKNLNISSSPSPIEGKQANISNLIKKRKNLNCATDFIENQEGELNYEYNLISEVDDLTKSSVDINKTSKQLKNGQLLNFTFQDVENYIRKNQISMNVEKNTISIIDNLNFKVYYEDNKLFEIKNNSLISNTCSTFDFKTGHHYFSNLVSLSVQPIPQLHSFGAFGVEKISPKNFTITQFNKLTIIFNE